VNGKFYGISKGGINVKGSALSSKKEKKRKKKYQI
jgi:hypothetical protein